jgi:hypothetical protein
MPDDAGNIKGIAQPKVPEHLYSIEVSEGEHPHHTTMYYYACRCGLCGTLHKSREFAEVSGKAHIWAARRKHDA